MNTSAAKWIENRRGAMAMSAAMALIIVNDAMIKLVNENLSAAQTIAVRGLFATALVLAAVLASGQGHHLGKALELRTLGRAVLDVLGTFSYLFSLFNMPLAEATAINMAAPLIMVVLAVVFLREVVPWRRWLAVGVGFAGMLLIVRPGGASFNIWAGLCLAATVVNVLRDLYTRRIPSHVPSLIITVATASAVTLTACALTTVQGWQAMTGAQMSLLAGASVFLAVAYYLMIVAMRLGDASVVGGFRYSALPAAAVLGWVLWGQIPDPPALTGMVILVAAGLYLLQQERRAAGMG